LLAMLHSLILVFSYFIALPKGVQMT
jgi:hypothetical protein